MPLRHSGCAAIVWAFSLLSVFLVVMYLALSVDHQTDYIDASLPEERKDFEAIAYWVVCTIELVPPGEAVLFPSRPHRGE